MDRYRYTPISGVSHSKKEYLDKTYHPLLAIFAGPTSCRVKRIIAESDTVVVQWHGETPLAKGGVYANEYCWVIRVAGGRLIEVTGYFDTAVVKLYSLDRLAIIRLAAKPLT